MVDRTALMDAVAAATPTRSGYWRTYCPFCEETEGFSTKRNFTVRVSTGRYQCWRCAETGVIRNLAESQFAGTAAREVEMPEVDNFPPPDAFVALGYGEGSGRLKYRPARDYLASRGVLWSTVQDCEIGACLSGKYRGSVVVPVKDRGAWRGYVCRRYRGKGYLYPAGMRRGSCMFNMDALRGDAAASPIYLVEGCFDALPHYPHAVACLGKPSRDHVDMLRQVKRRLAIVLDADAQREGWALAAQLQLDGVQAQFVKLPSGSDPGDVDPDWLKQRVSSVFS